MKNKSKAIDGHEISGKTRRDFIRKAVYASPVLLTLPATPSFAQQGSGSVSTGGDSGDGTGGTDGNVDTCSAGTPAVGQDETLVCHFGDNTTPGDSINVGLTDDELPEHIAHGDVFGSCEDFFCSAS